jgi:hypothetical protein
VDFCLRAGAQGHEIHYCADSEVVHLESVSPGRFERDRANLALYRKRWAKCVKPDDLQYYVEDGLLRLEYEGRFPLNANISADLATINEGARNADLESALRERNRQVADLARENTRLQMELGESAKGSPLVQYQKMRERIRAVARRCIPRGATVLVVSRGDGSLLNLGYKGWHFPRTSGGAYAGYHPANSGEAITHLEELRQLGAEYLLVPETCGWWFDHYAEFSKHLQTRYRQLNGLSDCCSVHSLRRVKTEKTRQRP